MDFSHSCAFPLWERHHALASLSKYLPNEKEIFFSFLNSVVCLEKALEEKTSPLEAQYQIISTLLTQTHFTEILLSPEWNKASQYFVVPSNEATLLNTYYTLEIGSENVLQPACELREKVLEKILFDNVWETEFQNTQIRFIFSPKTPRWHLESIEWKIEANQRITGALTISLGYPKIEGPFLYKNLFALYGSEKKAAALIALSSIQKKESALQSMAQELILPFDLGLEALESLFKKKLPTMDFLWQEWKQKDILSREFSPEGLRIFRNMRMFFQKKDCPEKVDYPKKCVQSDCPEECIAFTQHLQSLGLRWGNSGQGVEYRFSKQKNIGECLEKEPSLEYYWPLEKKIEIVLPACSIISAGPQPLFLEKIHELQQKQKINPRPQDLEAVQQFLLFISLGESKLSKPALLPVYNALQRWLKALEKEQNLLEELCLHAQIFRPHIYIPHVGEKIFGFANKNHQIVLEPSSLPEGTILKIKEAGIVVGDAQIPLFLKGTYWVACKCSE